MNKRQQTAILILLLLAWVTCCRGATVTFTWTNWDGSISTNDLVVRMIVQPLNDGTYTYKGLPIRFATTNGYASHSLAGALYDVVPYYSPGLTNIEPVVFAVPVNDTNTYDFWKLSHSGGRSFNFSPGVQAIYAGNNITIVATNGVSANSGDIVISSTGGGSGVSVAATAPVSATTNSSLVTLALSFMPMLASANLTNFSGLTTNFFYPSNNPAGFIPSNAIPGLYGYVTNAVTTNSSTGVSNVVTSIIGQTPITGLSNVRSGTPANGFVLTYQNGTWTNLPAQGTNTFIAAGANVTVTTNGSANLYTIASAASGVNVAAGSGIALSTNAGVVTASTNGQTLSWSGQTNWPLSQVTNAAVSRWTTNADGTSINGATLTNLNASKLASGTVPDARLSANVPLLSLPNVFANNNEFQGACAFDAGLNISVLLSADKLLIPSGATIGASNLFQVVNPSGQTELQLTTNGWLYLGTNNQLVVTPAGNVTFSGVGTGNGSGFTNLNATNLIGNFNAANLYGNAPDAILSSNIPRKNGQNNFVSSNYFSGPAIFGAGNGTVVSTNIFNINARGINNSTLEFLDANGTIDIFTQPYGLYYSPNTNRMTAIVADKVYSTAITNVGGFQIATARITNPTNAATVFNLGIDANGNVSTNSSAVGGGAQTNIAVAGVTNAGTAAYSNSTAFVLSSSGNATNLTSKATLSADSITATNLKSSALTAQRILVSDNGSPPSVTNMAAGGANTVLHGTTPPALSAVVEADLSLTDVVTANASTSTHGLMPKLSNDPTKFFNGQGNQVVPSTGIAVNAWKTNGNSGLPVGSFLGITDNAGLQLRANNRQVFFADELASVTVNANIVFGQGDVVATNGSTSGNYIMGGLPTSPNFITNGIGNASLGGANNKIYGAGNYNFIAGGNGNVISGGGQDGVVLGGTVNTVSATDAVAIGGSGNTAGATKSIAAGGNAFATNSGSFVWNAADGTAFGSKASFTFNVRAPGGEYHNSGSSMFASNSLANWPTAPNARGDAAIVNSNGYPYILLSTNGGIGSATWTGTNKLGW